MARQRFENPVLDEEIELRLFTYNANKSANVVSIDQIKIYKLYDLERTDDNPDGKRLIYTIPADQITQDGTGQYSTILDLVSPLFTCGTYSDEWEVQYEDCENSTVVKNYFTIVPDLWYTDIAPVVYDFTFRFIPNRMVKGSKKYITIIPTPCVPTGYDLTRYYQNLIKVAPMTVTIVAKCGCLPQEYDLRVVVEDDPITYQDGCKSYYFIDTDDFDCGLYDIQFKLEMGESVFVSPKNQFLVYE